MSTDSPVPPDDVRMERSHEDDGERDETLEKPALDGSLRVVRTGGTARTIALREKHGISSRDTEVDILNDPVVQTFVAETGCPVYSAEAIKCEDVSQLLVTPEQVDPDKVCCRIPPSCPGVGQWLFVISLDHVDPDDISYDELGKYVKPSGRRHFYERTGDGLKRLMGRDKEPADWDFCVRFNRYSHPGAGHDGRFIKYTYLAFNSNNDLLGPYGMIQYIAEVDPNTLRRLPHSNAKVDKPLLRTKPSALKQAKTLLLTQSPKEVMETMVAAQSILNDEMDPTELPRNASSISNLARKVPGAVRNRRGRPRGSKSALVNRVMRAAGGFAIEVPEISQSTTVVDEEPEVTPIRAQQQARHTPATPYYGGGMWKHETKPKFDALHVQVLQSEKRRNDAEMEKFEIEKDKLLTEKEKLESEHEMVKMNQEKLRLEIEVLKAKKFKLDIELSKVREDDDNVVIVHEGMDYRSYE